MGGRQQAGDYQHYMKQYTGDFHVKNWSNTEEVRDIFVKKFAGDYQKYMKQGSKRGQQGGDYQQYLQQYAGDVHVKNWSNTDEVRDSFVKKFAGGYQKYMKQDGENRPQSSDDQQYVEHDASDLEKHASQGKISSSADKVADVEEEDLSDPKEQDVETDDATPSQAFLASRTPARSSSRVSSCLAAAALTAALLIALVALGKRSRSKDDEDTSGY